MTTHRDPISQSQAATVLDAYSVGRLMFVRPGAGTANPAVIAVTSEGQFFLKRRNPRYSSRGQLVYDHAVIRHLARSGLPVVPPVRTLGGSRWHELNDAIYELYPLVARGQHEPGNAVQIEAAGRALAAFHSATEGFEPGGDKPLPRLHDPQDSLRGLMWARDQLASGSSSAHGGPEVVLRLIEAAEGIRKRLPEQAYWDLPQCVIHGDYHPANLKFADDQVAGIFDFDWVGRGPRMVDVADGLMFFCGLRQRPADPDDIVSLTQAFELDRGAMSAFGRGYGGGITPAAEELRALPDLVRARWLFCRVDAMERKVPQDQKLDYLLADIQAPLQEIAEVSEWLAAGGWLR